MRLRSGLESKWETERRNCRVCTDGHTQFGERVVKVVVGD
jgi:hypothetical protein